MGVSASMAVWLPFFHSNSSLVTSSLADMFFHITLQKMQNARPCSGSRGSVPGWGYGTLTR
jgi:hypothetical protein